MTDAAALELRHVRLAEQVTLRPAPLGDGGEEGVFVALDDSPPVRTVVAVVEGGRRRALEVAWVVEVPEPGDAGGSSTRGFYGRWVGDEALERAAKVGTEHLEDGTPVVQPVVHDNSSVLDVSDTAMAMPAPVIVLDDDSGASEVEDDEERERSDAATEAGEAHEGEAHHSEAHHAEAHDAEAHDAEAAGRQAMQAVVADVVRSSSEVADTAEHAETISYPENIYTAETVNYPEHAVGERPEEPAAAEASAATPGASEDGPDTLHYADYQRPGASEGAEQDAAEDGASGSDAQGEPDGEPDAAEASTDAAETPSDSGDPGESRSKGRKKRKRRR